MNYTSAVTIYTENSKNAYAETNWSGGVEYKARVVEETKTIPSVKGELIRSDLTVHLPLDTSTSGLEGKKLTYSSTNYTILTVEMPRNEVGHIRDIKLLCQRYERGN